MVQKVALFLIACLVCIFAWGQVAASAADLGIYQAGRYNGLGTLHHLGFWGRPFPYGYRWSLTRACTRYEPVDTPHGVRMKRVWVCRR